jgi:hypothetical protein
MFELSGVDQAENVFDSALCFIWLNHLASILAQISGIDYLGDHGEVG